MEKLELEFIFKYLYFKLPWFFNNLTTGTDIPVAVEVHFLNEDKLHFE